MNQAANPARSPRQAKDRLDRAVAYYASKRGVPTIQLRDEIVRALITLYGERPGRTARA